MYALIKGILRNPYCNKQNLTLTNEFLNKKNGFHINSFDNQQFHFNY